MGGLALAAKQRGFKVSGLDETAAPPMSDWLDEHNLSWARQFEAHQLRGVDTLVISGAHGGDDHPVIVAARKHHIRIISFAQLFGELTADKRVIAVSGTHGKTTTTAFITWVLETAGRRPDYLVGIRPFNFDASSRLDGSETVVVEADEYKASTLDSTSKFSYYHSNVLVITSIEHDHPDVFPDLASTVERFKQVTQALPANGRLVAWSGSSTVMAVAAEAPCEVITYGTEDSDFRARNVAYLPAGIEFDLETPDGLLGRLAVPLYGRHNVLNALAASAVVLGEGLTFNHLLDAAASFKGAFRRFNLVSPSPSQVTVIDDYAHHPTEVATTIEAARLHFRRGRLIVVFRPHTYSRTKTLLSDYQQVFGQADYVFITEVESAREAANAKTVSGADIVAGLPATAVFEPDRAKLVERIVALAEPGDVVLCMSVSGYENLAPELAKKLTSIR